ncbi:MAG: hypothetical protein H0V33_05210 [Acidimicrobiia bacterium]|nr:hypothetical protein [Acidimicrobiia bacterium]
MTVTLWLLAVQGTLGAFDTVYFHEWRARLPVRPDMRIELALHAVRSVIYGIVFCSLPWLAWTGAAGVLLAVLLVAEAVITFTDFVVEDRVRPSLGGVFPGERVMHGLMAVVYGAFLAVFAPVLGGWISTGGREPGATGPTLLLVALTTLGVGSLLSGLRDALVASGCHSAAWPWRPQVHEARSPAPPRSAVPGVAVALGVLAVLVAAARPRARS